VLNIPLFDSCKYGSLIHAPGAVFRREKLPCFLHLSFILSGAAILSREKRDLTVETGHLFIVPGGKSAEWSYTEEMETCEVFVDFFLKRPNKAAQKWREKFPAVMPTSRQAEKIFETLLTIESHPYLLSDKTATAGILRHLGQALLGVLDREAKMLSESDEHGEEPRAIERAVSIIRNYYHHPLTLDGIAQRCGVTKHHLIRSFKAAKLPTPMKYLWRERLRHGLHLLQTTRLSVKEIACRLLQTTRLSVKEIACRTGFKTPWHFCKLFKQEHDKTPQAVRRARGGEG